jgi:hypothetical protein
VPRPRLLGGLLHGTLLDHRHPRGDTDHDARAEDDAAPDDFFDEETEHTLRDVVIRDHTVAQRAYGNDVAGRAPDHAARILSDGEHLIRVAVDGDDGRFLEDDALAFHIDEDVCRPEVDSYIH